MRLHDPWLLLLLLLAPLVVRLAGARTLATICYPATEMLRAAGSAGRAKVVEPCDSQSGVSVF